ncbi:MAG: DUF547 domain-containing protein [Planctomycetaceae bacterium]|nr:DUF547 domain-containing protein [Planctomycetaceae bacterium]
MKPWLRASMLLLPTTLLVISTNLVQAEDVFVGKNVPATNQIALDKIDHSNWDILLKKYVNNEGRVNYSAWKKSSADLQQLDQYLAHLSHSNSQGTSPEKLAFWINAYNAVTVKGILREYPTTSIRNHTARVWGYNIWKNLKLYVSGKPVSLDQMEHQLLRKMNEPRIHFAIVCASIGCPQLLNEAYTPEKLDEQLTTNARHFFADQSQFRYNSSNNTFYVSSILDWFGEDFGRTEKERLQRISLWLTDDQAKNAASTGKGTFSFLEYNWNLNDQKN